MNCKDVNPKTGERGLSGEDICGIGISLLESRSLGHFTAEPESFYFDQAYGKRTCTLNAYIVAAAHGTRALPHIAREPKARRIGMAAEALGMRYEDTLRILTGPERPQDEEQAIELLQELRKVLKATHSGKTERRTQ